MKIRSYFECLCYRGDMIAVEKKLDEGVSINARDSSRRSLLYHAVMYGQTEVAQLLIKRYINFKISCLLVTEPDSNVTRIHSQKKHLTMSD